MTIQDDTNSAWQNLETNYQQLMSAVRNKRSTTIRWTYFQGAYDWLTSKIKKEEEEVPPPPPEPPPVDIDAAWKIFQFSYGTLVGLIRRADTRLLATPVVTPPPPVDQNYEGLNWEQRLDALLQGWVRTDGTINYDSPLCPFKR
jgi:hypothetical protein